MVFQECELSSMNCEYHANKRAWMIGILFQKYVRQLDGNGWKKVILLVDNCSAHRKMIEVLKIIESFFLPFNKTSKIHTFDAGIRAQMMHYY